VLISLQTYHFAFTSSYFCQLTEYMLIISMYNILFKKNGQEKLLVIKCIFGIMVSWRTTVILQMLQGFYTIKVSRYDSDKSTAIPNIH